MLIKCRVIANAKEVGIVRQSDGSYKIRLNVKPIEGKANKKLIEVLAEHFKVSKSSVSIVRGETSRNKTIEIV